MYDAVAWKRRSVVFQTGYVKGRVTLGAVTEEQFLGYLQDVRAEKCSSIFGTSIFHGGRMEEVTHSGYAKERRLSIKCTLN